MAIRHPQPHDQQQPRSRTPEARSTWAVWSWSWQGMPPAGNTFGLREYMLVKGEEEKQQQKVGWRLDELSRLLWTGTPTDLHWCTDATMPSIHIHSRNAIYHINTTPHIFIFTIICPIKWPFKRNSRHCAWNRNPRINRHPGVNITK